MSYTERRFSRLAFLRGVAAAGGLLAAPKGLLAAAPAVAAVEEPLPYVHPHAYWSTATRYSADVEAQFAAARAEVWGKK